jgi:hypothetical protein
MAHDPARPVRRSDQPVTVHRFLVPRVTETPRPTHEEVEARRAARERVEDVLRRRSDRMRDR